MTREEAIRMLDPETTGEAMAEIEYYGGFRGRAAVVQAVLDACVLAVAALREQEERDNRLESDAVKNEPLTLDELREMDGEPVWIVWTDGRIESKWRIVGNYDWHIMEFDDDLTNYGKKWLAYRSKQKEDDE